MIRAQHRGFLAFLLSAFVLLSCGIGWPLLEKEQQNVSVGIPAPQFETGAKAAVLIEADSGKIIWQKNVNQTLPMASTTKIMTALLTLSQPHQDESFTVDTTAIHVEGSSMGLRDGDTVSLYALAVGMLTVSGNDAANAAAVRISGSIPAFVALMNKTAAQLGMKNTHFATPSGLDKDDHFSTAFDMALLGAAAIQNPAFAKICGAKSVSAVYGNPAFSRTLSNSNRLLRTCPGCIGIKTGFTTKAGRCLVTAACRDGMTLVCVTLDDHDDWNDHTNLYNYGFGQVEKVALNPENGPFTVKVAGTGQSVLLQPEGQLYACVIKGEHGQIQTEVKLPKLVFAPVQKGQVIGRIEYIYNSKIIKVQNLVASEDVFPIKKWSIWDRLRDLMIK